MATMHDTVLTVIQVILFGVLALLSALFALAFIVGVVAEAVNFVHRLIRGRYPSSRHASAKGRWSH